MLPPAAGAVLDYERLAEPLLKSGGHCAHHDVDAAAGRERDDEDDRSKVYLQFTPNLIDDEGNVSNDGRTSFFKPTWTGASPGLPN